MKNKKEKEKFVKDLEMMLNTSWEFEDFFDFMEKMCITYRDLYVKPYFGAFGEHLAPMKFDRTPPQKVTENGKMSYSAEVEAFYFDNTVTLNIGILINIDDEDASYKGFTVDNILSMLMAVGHEYEHNFQFKGKEVADHLAKNKERFRAKINSITDKYAYELGDIKTTLHPDEDKIRALLEMTNSWKDFDKFFPDQKDQIVDYCTDAIYYNRHIEIDARSVGMKIFKNFIKDAINLTHNKKFIGYLKDHIYLEKFWDEHQTSTKYDSDAGSYYNKYVNVINKISEKDYVEYAKTLIKAINKEYYEQLKQNIENGKPFPKEDYIYGQFERDVLIKSFFALHDTSTDKTKFSTHIDTINAISLELTFLKFGVPIGDYLFTQNYKFDEEEKKFFLEKYFEMLKNGNISFDSFSRVNELSHDQQKELLCTYINRGQTEFVTNMLYAIDSDNRQALLTDKLDQNQKFGTNILGGIEKKICRMSLDLEQQKHNRNEKSLQYDDIDDMITLISDICQMCGVPYDRKTLDLSYCNEHLSQEFCKKLHNLYVMAETIGYDAVCQIDGCEPPLDGYRFAHAQDRKLYTLSGKEAEERQKQIYGEIAFYQRDWANNLNKDLNISEWANTQNDVQEN